MHVFNEATREWEERPVRFTIAGRQTSDEDMLVQIPMEYADLFEGHEFPSMERFSKALMHAHVAEEAYGRPWVAEEAERSLKRCLE
jgi:hypothetical protein